MSNLGRHWTLLKQFGSLVTQGKHVEQKFSLSVAPRQMQNLMKEHSMFAEIASCSLAM
jgi:hypothetical protein